MIGFLLIASITACKKPPEKPKHDLVKANYLKAIAGADTSARQLNAAVKSKASEGELQDLFKRARLAYKRCEVFAEYYSPLTAKSINGAPIEEADVDDQNKKFLPEGFQVIEAFIFQKYDSASNGDLLEETGKLVSNFQRLRTYSETLHFADPQIFDALRLEIFRIITLGISGFDAALAQNSMPEAASALSSVQNVLTLYADSLKLKDENLYSETQNLLQHAQGYLNGHKDFNSFNRMEFILRYGSPLSAHLLKSSQTLSLKKMPDLRALKADAPTLFSPGAFDPDFYTAGIDAHSSPQKTTLGKKLFFDPVLSGNGTRSCASCHQPQKAFTDGTAKMLTLNGKSRVRRNTPTVLNAGLQPALFYDLRVVYLEDQATEVINNPDEMHGDLRAAIEKIKKEEEYAGLFKRAFLKSKDPVQEYNLRNALGSYIRSLTALNSRFDQYVRGDLKKLNQPEVRGFNLYMGKAKCGTCHFAPLFNGTVPPDFAKIETEVIGVPASDKSKKIDTDLGRYNLRKIELHKYAFRTPTVRNVALTAPYMHNGIYKSLEEVIDFYNKGGASGLGIELENQTLPFDKLNLTNKEKGEIVSFLKTLTDTGAVKQP